MTKIDPVKLLVRLSRTPISLTELCDRLDMSPARVLALAQKHKVKLEKGNDHVQLSAKEQIRTVQDTRVLPVRGRRQQVGVISDLHLGSKYCLRAQLRDCVQHMYERGIREILVPGDLLQGWSKKWIFELSHPGFTDQIEDLRATIPRLRGLTYWAITGNHDETWFEISGIDVGEAIHAVRPDINFVGRCGAFVKIRGAIGHMWHPLGGTPYAKSYRLQKKIEEYSAGEKPDFLLAGHLHQYAHVEERGVFGALCPTFQASGSAFSKRLAGNPALGGLILSWEIAGKDLVRNFSIERRRYYELELSTRVPAK